MSSPATDHRIGFVGLGVMGQPMALNLQRSGVRLVVWNRTPARCALVVAAGATQAPSIDALFAASSTVILMLADEGTTDHVLDRSGDRFSRASGGQADHRHGDMFASMVRGS